MLWVYLFSALGTFATDWQWQTITIRATQLWYIYRWFCDSESKRKSNQRLNNIMVCWENEENNGRNGKNTRRKAEGTDRKRERESEEINRNIERRGPEKPCVGFVNGKLKLRLDILLISERDYFTSNQNTYFICFSCFIHTQTGRNSHTHTYKPSPPPKQRAELK